MWVWAWVLTYEYADEAYPLFSLWRQFKLVKSTKLKPLYLWEYWELEARKKTGHTYEVSTFQFWAVFPEGKFFRPLSYRYPTTWKHCFLKENENSVEKYWYRKNANWVEKTVLKVGKVFQWLGNTFWTFFNLVDYASIFEELLLTQLESWKCFIRILIC